MTSDSSSFLTFKKIKRLSRQSTVPDTSQSPGNHTDSSRLFSRSSTRLNTFVSYESRGDRNAGNGQTSSVRGSSPQTQPSTVNVVLFGETGVGKSSVINLIARRDIAKVSSDVNGCTMQSQRYNISFDNTDFAIFDTIGLEEPQMGVNGYLKAIERAYDLIHKLGNAGGIHLLLFCMRGGRITATTQSNYRLFHECLCSTKVPIALVFTGLEREVKMEDWWMRNKKHIEDYGIKSDGHACITAVQDETPEDHKYEDSQKIIRDLLKNCARKNEAFSPESHSWFAKLAKGMKSFIPAKKNPKKKDVLKVLMQRCKLDAETARKIAEMMEKGDAETQDPQAGNGEGEGEGGRESDTATNPMNDETRPSEHNNDAAYIVIESEGRAATGTPDNVKVASDTAGNEVRGVGGGGMQGHPPLKASSSVKATPGSVESESRQATGKNVSGSSPPKAPSNDNATFDAVRSEDGGTTGTFSGVRTSSDVVGNEVREAESRSVPPKTPGNAEITPGKEARAITSGNVPGHFPQNASGNVKALHNVIGNEDRELTGSGIPGPSINVPSNAKTAAGNGDKLVTGGNVPPYLLSRPLSDVKAASNIVGNEDGGITGGSTRGYPLPNVSSYVKAVPDGNKDRDVMGRSVSGFPPLKVVSSTKATSGNEDRRASSGNMPGHSPPNVSNGVKAVPEAGKQKDDVGQLAKKGDDRRAGERGTPDRRDLVDQGDDIRHRVKKGSVGPTVVTKTIERKMPGGFINTP